jgi:hypothetical protein
MPRLLIILLMTLFLGLRAMPAAAVMLWYDQTLIDAETNTWRVVYTIDNNGGAQDITEFNVLYDYDLYSAITDVSATPPWTTRTAVEPELIGADAQSGRFNAQAAGQVAIRPGESASSFAVEFEYAIIDGVPGVPGPQPYQLIANAGGTGTPVIIQEQGTAVNHMVTTNPPGRTFTVDGTPYTAPQSFAWAAGEKHTIAIATSPQAGTTGTQYVFATWSDSGAQSHSYTVPATPSTLTANFTTQYQLTTAITPTGKGSVSPVSGNWFAANSAVPVKAFPNVGYSFGSWTGAVAAPTSAATTVTMSGPLAIAASVNGSPALTAAITAASGLPTARLWTIKLTNSGQGIAYGARITGLTLTQTYGATCTLAPGISSLPIPVSPVNVAAAGGTSTGQVTIDFSGCPSTARFTAVIGFDANGGSVTGTKSYGNQTR